MGVEHLWEQMAYVYTVSLSALFSWASSSVSDERQPVVAVDVRVGYMRYVSRSTDRLFQQFRCVSATI